MRMNSSLFQVRAHDTMKIGAHRKEKKSLTKSNTLDKKCAKDKYPYVFSPWTKNIPCSWKIIT